MQHVQARARAFLTFNYHQTYNLQERVKSLTEWIDELAASCRVPLSFDKLPDKLGLIAEGRCDELAREYMARGLWDEALLLTSLGDEVAVEVTASNCTRAELRKVVNFLGMREIKFLEKSSWVAELSLVLRCFYF